MTPVLVVFGPLVFGVAGPLGIVLTPFLSGILALVKAPVLKP